MLLPLILALQVAGPPTLDWLVGNWCTEVRDGKQTCEQWSPPGPDGVLRGASETRRGDQRAGETMTLALQDGVWVLRVQQPGQPIVGFRAVSSSPGQEIRFENRSNPYPQVIRYWREGSMLRATVSLASGDSQVAWDYRPVR